MNRIFLGLTMLMLFLPAMAMAEGTTCFGDETIVVPDGRITASFIPIGATFRLAFIAEVGHSYSVEVRTPNQVYFFPLATTVFDGNKGVNGNCTRASNLLQTDTTSISPRLMVFACQGCGSGSTRISFTQSYPNFESDLYHDITIVNNSSAGSIYTFSVSDTTMYSPGFSTSGGFDAYYSFLNTTNSTVNITLQLFWNDVFGLEGSWPAVAAIPPGGTYATHAFALGVPNSVTGSARLMHDGPPGAILATALNGNFSTGYLQSLPFVAVREKY
jgi:hypothetical protein